MIKYCWVNANIERTVVVKLKQDFYFIFFMFSLQIAKTTQNKRSFILLEYSQQRLPREGVLLSLARNVTAWPWPAQQAS